MLKCWISIIMLICCGSARAEEIGPWFGSAVASPEQVSIVAKAKNMSNLDQRLNCTIYNCIKLKNIVKPELKSASNP